MCQDCPKGTRAFKDLDAAGAAHDLRTLGLWVAAPLAEILHVAPAESKAPDGVALRWRKRHH